MADDLQPQVLGIVALAVVLADQRLERLGQADEADGQRAVFEHLAHLVVRAELVGIDPHTLSHQKREIAHLLFRLDLEPFQKLLDHKVDFAVKLLEKPVDIAFRPDGDTRQIDRSKAQVSAAVDNLAAWIIVVGDDARTAAHVSDFRLGTTGLIILKIKRRVDK